MNKRGILFILLAAAVLLVVVGAGLLKLRSPAKAKVVIPDANPVIYERLAYVMRGEFTYLYIYDDGNILYIEEKGMRFPGGYATRSWKTGQFTQQQLGSFLEYMNTSGIEKLEDYYKFPGEPIQNGTLNGFKVGDMRLTLSVDSENISKTISASGYLTPDKGETYPDMPPPLNEIYVRLRILAQGTQEVAFEKIPKD